MAGAAFDFKAQLEVGSRGEELFMANYPRPLEIWPGRDGDFIVKETGQKLEVKTDTYNIEKTPNFFIERYSNVAKKSPGSVWQALEHGCSIFCYMYVRHNIWFEFNDLPALRDRLDKLIEGKGYIAIKNKGWITAGYKIPRIELADLYTINTFLTPEVNPANIKL